jgi:hypothetical protein
MYTHSNSSSR